MISNRELTFLHLLCVGFRAVHQICNDFSGCGANRREQRTEDNDQGLPDVHFGKSAGEVKFGGGIIGERDVFIFEIRRSSIEEF